MVTHTRLSDASTAAGDRPLALLSLVPGYARSWGKRGLIFPGLPLALIAGGTAWLLGGTLGPELEASIQLDLPNDAALGISVAAIVVLANGLLGVAVGAYFGALVAICVGIGRLAGERGPISMALVVGLVHVFIIMRGGDAEDPQVALLLSILIEVGLVIGLVVSVRSLLDPEYATAERNARLAMRRRMLRPETVVFVLIFTALVSAIIISALAPQYRMASGR